MRLILIDGNAILHRAYHALPPLTNRQGQVVNAVYGFCTMLFRVVEDLKPTHLVVAFDTEKPTFRHAAYVGYQAQRPRVESDLVEQFALTQDVLRAAGIPIFAIPGYEADDVIGSLAFQAVSRAEPRKKEARNHAEEIEVIIVTGDRDLLQLVNKDVKVYLPVKGLTEARLVDEVGVKDYIGVEPRQIVDYKALVGDPSDNYPGVVGIGPKTAIFLIKKFKTVDGIYKNLKKLPERLVVKLTGGHDSAILSRQLAQIETNAPITLNLEEAKLAPFVGNKALIEKFQELGFRSLVGRLEGGKTKITKQKTGNKAESQLKLVD